MGFIKKVLLGVIIGVILTIPCVTLANSYSTDTNGFKVKINNSETGKKTVNIDGSTYLSIDDVSQLFGYDLYINETDGEVNLLSKSGYQPRPEIGNGEITLEAQK